MHGHHPVWGRLVYQQLHECSESNVCRATHSRLDDQKVQMHMAGRVEGACCCPPHAALCKLGGQASCTLAIVVAAIMAQASCTLLPSWLPSWLRHHAHSCHRGCPLQAPVPPPTRRPVHTVGWCSSGGQAPACGAHGQRDGDAAQGAARAATCAHTHTHTRWCSFEFLDAPALCIRAQNRLQGNTDRWMVSVHHWSAHLCASCVANL